jgi:spermidine/putrescine transport system ATP-binding protein
VRPEKIRIGAPREGDNVLKGTVMVASYLGTSLQYVVHTPAGAEITVMAQNVGDPAAAPGAEVELAFRPEHTFVV